MQTEPPKAGPPKRKRRWFQFSLRSLLIFTLICAIPCAWLGRKIEQKRKEREAVESMVKDGFSVMYDSQLDPRGTPYSNEQPPGPGWLRKVLGDNFFSEAKRVFVFGDRRGTKTCTDAGLERIGELTHLQWVSLDSTNVSDSGLVRIEALTELQILDLGDTAITDVGLEHVEGLSQLSSLYLTGTKITDAGLERVKGLTRLVALGLEGTKVTDAGLEKLTNLTRLGNLILDGTKVSDAGIAKLKGLTNLRFLYLNGTKVTAAGVAELQKALPNCSIAYRPTVQSPAGRAK
jgi:Leucine-rich repeat (LRR) protein